MVLIWGQVLIKAVLILANLKGARNKKAGFIIIIIIRILQGLFSQSYMPIFTLRWSAKDTHAYKDGKKTYNCYSS